MTEWLLLAVALTAYPPTSLLGDAESAAPRQGERVQWDEDDSEDNFDMPEGDFEMPAGEDDPPPSKDDKGKKDKKKAEPKEQPKKPAPKKGGDDLFVDDEDIDDDDILVPADDEPPPKASADPWGTADEPGASPEAEEPRRRLVEDNSAAEDPGSRRLIAGEDAPAPAPKPKPRRALDEQPKTTGPLTETRELRLEVEEPEGTGGGLDPLLLSAIAGGGALLVVGVLVGTAAAVVITGPPVLGIWEVPANIQFPWLQTADTGTIVIQPQ